MPNGFHGTEHEWERLEAPLRRLDTVLDEFARSRNLTLSKNGSGWPERSFRWGAAPERLIQIFLENATTPSYTIWVSASDDRSRAEYWKHETLGKAVPRDFLEQQLPGLLVRAYERAMAWADEYERAG